MASNAGLTTSAQPGEHFGFQLAIVNVMGTAPLIITAVSFSDLKDAAGQTIPASAASCMNTEGSDFWGRDFKIDRVVVPAGEVKSLWVKLVVPSSAAAGTFRGTAHTTAGGHTVSTPIALSIAGPALENGGDDDIERGTRIHWFDSKVGLADDTGAI